MNEPEPPNTKPFPMPGTIWQWKGNEMIPDVGRPLIVSGLRWFRTRVEALFAGDSCAGVNHLMTVDAWEYLGRVDLSEEAELVLAAARAQGAAEEQIRCVFVCEAMRRAIFGKPALEQVVNEMANSIAHGKSTSAGAIDRTHVEHLLTAYIERQRADARAVAG